jgi:hypothetical protein
LGSPARDDDPAPSGNLREEDELAGGSIGEVAVVEEPERGWLVLNCGMRLRLRLFSCLFDVAIMNYEPVSFRQKTMIALTTRFVRA